MKSIQLNLQLGLQVFCKDLRNWRSRLNNAFKFPVLVHYNIFSSVEFRFRFNALQKLWFRFESVSLQSNFRGWGLVRVQENKRLTRFRYRFKFGLGSKPWLIAA